MSPNYWKLRALSLIAVAAEDARNAALAKFFAEMREAGYDPAKEHRYDDTRETIEVVTDGDTARQGRR